MADVTGHGFTAAPDAGVCIASLRYLSITGPFLRAVHAAVGVALPETGRLVHGAGGSILAWRRPGELLLIAKGRAPAGEAPGGPVGETAGNSIAELERAAASLTDGCVVDLTGGVVVVRVRGPGGERLLACLGGPNVIPAASEARTGRLAELAVTALRTGPEEIALLVERVYAAHLMDWISVSAPEL